MGMTPRYPIYMYILSLLLLNMNLTITTIDINTVIDIKIVYGCRAWFHFVKLLYVYQSLQIHASYRSYNQTSRFLDVLLLHARL